MAFQLRKRACIGKERISKVTLKAMVSGKTKELFSNLDDDDWDIESFNSCTRVVCVILYSQTEILIRSLNDQIEEETDLERLFDLEYKKDSLISLTDTNKRIHLTLPQITFNPS